MPRTTGILLLITSAAWAANTAPDRIRDAAAKGLALVQSTQKDWYSKQSCNSCHNQILPAIAMQAARQHGVPFDEAAARAHIARNFAFLTSVDRAVQYHDLIDPAMSEGYELLAADYAGVAAPNLSAAIYARHIALRQQADGHWMTEDARPPQSYSTITATAVALRTIQVYHHASLAADARSRVDKAGRWLADVTPHNTEERVYQLYGLKWAGADSALIARLAGDLASRQQPDGGWNTLDDRASDAYSTGQALTALAEVAGIPSSDAAWGHGIQYLLDTQAADGSWHVPSRIRPPAQVSPPYFESGYPYGHDQFISTMGASWAIRALAIALGPASGKGAFDLPEVAPKDVEPWVETALFGSAAELRQALDKGLDPNAATRAGGTTLLMLVQPDMDKTRLLVDRGARINARSKSKYSALMLACLYPGGSPTARFLLDRGAEMRLPKGAGAPMFNANPLVMAVYGSNGDLIGPLVKAGARVDEPMLILGMFPATPAITAVGFGDTPTVRALLDSGANPNETDRDGFTLLSLAVIAHHADTARLLIERGAHVNGVDPKGMTALLYAAAADFGDSSMVDLLLRMGADPNVRTKESLTAQDLARRYGHTSLMASLLAKR